MKNIKGIKGYKVFDENWTCEGIQYKVEETYAYECDIRVCGSGFIFFQKASKCFNYYDFDSKNKVAEVLVTGNVINKGDKYLTDKITIVREIPWSELLTIVNEGSCCTGLSNTGNYNTGNYNTGDWNATNYSTGLFNTKKQKIYIFNKLSDWTLEDWFESDVRQILNWNFESSVWVYEENMTEEEKEKYPTYKTTGGYLKTFDFKEACKNMWDRLTNEEKNKVITGLPNFDSEIFKEITGIDVTNNVCDNVKKDKL